MSLIHERAMADARAAVREAQFAERRAKAAERQAEIVAANEAWMQETKAHREKVETLLQTLIDEIREKPAVEVTLPPIDPIPRDVLEKALKRVGCKVIWMESPVPEHEKDANQLAYALGRLLDAWDRYPNITADTKAATVFAHETLGHHNARIKKCTPS